MLQEAFQQIIRPNDCEEAFAQLNVPEEKINLPDGSFCVQDSNRIASSCVVSFFLGKKPNFLLKVSTFV